MYSSHDVFMTDVGLSGCSSPSSNSVLMALDTRKPIRRSHAKVIPMTAEVIAWVNYLGQGKKSLLTFQNRRGEDIGERRVN